MVCRRKMGAGSGAAEERDGDWQGTMQGIRPGQARRRRVQMAWLTKRWAEPTSRISKMGSSMKKELNL